MHPIGDAIQNSNRAEGGPDAVLQMVEDRCGGDFADINDVIPHADLAAHADHYKKISGASVDVVNNAPPILQV